MASGDPELVAYSLYRCVMGNATMLPPRSFGPSSALMKLMLFTFIILYRLSKKFCDANSVLTVFAWRAATYTTSTCTPSIVLLGGMYNVAELFDCCLVFAGSRVVVSVTSLAVVRVTVIKYDLT